MNLKREMLMIIIPFLFTLLFIPCVKKIAEFIGAMDLPNERKVHKVPIARLGGLGIYGGFLIGYMIKKFITLMNIKILKKKILNI